MTDTHTGPGNRELLLVAETVAREKSIEKDQVLEAMEQAIQKAGRSKYGYEHDIRAKIDRKTGEISLVRCQEVVEELENPATQLTLEEAQAIDPNLKVGDVITEPLPPIDFGRVAAQTAKQVIFQKVRDAERHRQFEEYKDRVGEVVSGIVKRVEFGNIFIELGKAEALLRRDEMIPRENIRVGDRVRAYIYDVREEPRGAQIFVSRTRPEFMAKLFMQEVPEIYDGIIEIKTVARDPGSRAKIAVTSSDPSIDPVGSCVGMRGSRVQAVVSELQGEKIDIIPWSANPATFIVNALAPAEVAKVVVDEANQRIDVVVPDEQLSLAIGRRGQNVRLASILSGWKIDILTEAQESERRTEEINLRSKTFVEALDVDEMIAHLLIAEGFAKIEEVAYIDLKELSSIEGFDAELATELQNRAKTYLEAQERHLTKRIKELKLAKDLTSLEGLDLETLVALGEKNIKTLDDLADLAGDELLELLPEARLTEEKAQEIIMAARAHWFEAEKESTES
ncbi:transcription termination factor NusA [Kamptonema cortianum]|jgi:N utilization substance protein A|nr:transcription termination factor NusA [Geitlerinema splendidum]MDK3161384.1 transcription termination factor NusA [Kamptonema cortianum]